MTTKCGRSSRGFGWWTLLAIAVLLFASPPGSTQESESSPATHGFVSSHALFSDDFEAGLDLSVWHTDIIAGAAWAHATEAGNGHMYCDAQNPVSYSDRWTDIHTQKNDFGDFTFTWDMRFRNEGAHKGSRQVYFRADGAVPYYHGYRINILNGYPYSPGPDWLVLAKLNSDGSSEHLSGIILHEWTLHQWYSFKLEVFGNVSKLKVWAKGDPEPTTWLLETIDPSSTFSSGSIGFGNYWRGMVDVDNVTVTPLVQIDPRSAGFWKHQCSDLGFHQVSPEELGLLFSDVADASAAFPGCANLSCSVFDIDGAQNLMRPKAERQALALWLNVTSDRLPADTDIELPDLTSATTVGEAISEIEATLCDPFASRGDLEVAKDIGEALNLGGEDMELASLESTLTVMPGATRTVTLGLINMSPANRNYELTALAPWPVQLSTKRVNGLGSNQLTLITAEVTVPWDVQGETQIQITAWDRLSDAKLQREATVTFSAAGSDPGNGQERILKVD